MAAGHPVSPPAEIIAFILAKEFGVLPSAILQSELGDVLKWWTIFIDLQPQRKA